MGLTPIADLEALGNPLQAAQNHREQHSYGRQIGDQQDLGRPASQPVDERHFGGSHQLIGRQAHHRQADPELGDLAQGADVGDQQDQREIQLEAQATAVRADRGQHMRRHHAQHQRYAGAHVAPPMQLAGDHGHAQPGHADDE